MKFKTFYYLKNKPNQNYSSFNDTVENDNNLILDKIGIIQFLKFCYPLYDRTFIKNIKFGFSWSNGEKISFRYNEKREGYSEGNETILWQIIQNSLKKICLDNKKKYGIGNSGGLDSRIILYILKKLNVNFKAYTLGAPHSDAVYIANKTAKVLNFQNKNIKIEYDFLRKYWNIIIEKTPMYSLLTSWYYSALKNLPNFEIHITGFNGDNMLGSHLSNDLFDIENNKELFRYIYEHYSYVHDDLIKKVLNDDTFVDKSYNDFLKKINKSENVKKENIFEEFNFKCRQLKFIINAVNFDYCGNFEWESPFCSKKFMDFALNLTFEERFQRKLQYNTAKRFMKEFKKLRFERDFKSLKDKNTLKILTKKIFWKFDKKLKLHLYYKGNHKDVRNWLIQDNSVQFIADKLKKPSKLFDEIFNTKYILKNINLIFKSNLYLLFNLLTVKLWIEEKIKNFEGFL